MSNVLANVRMCLRHITQLACERVLLHATSVVSVRRSLALPARGSSPADKEPHGSIILLYIAVNRRRRTTLRRALSPLAKTSDPQDGKTGSPRADSRREGTSLTLRAYDSLPNHASTPSLQRPRRNFASSAWGHLAPMTLKRRSVRISACSYPRRLSFPPRLTP